MNYVSAREGVPVPTKPYERAGRAEWVACKCGLKHRPGAFHICIDLSADEPIVAPKPKPEKKAPKPKATPKPRAARKTGKCACGASISREATSCRSCEGKRRKAAGTLPRYVGPIDARIKEVARRYLAGETMQQLADDLGVTSSGVRNALRRHGVPLRKPGEDRRGTEGKRALTDGQTAEAGRLYESGLSMDAVAVRFGISQHAVSNALRRLGVQTRPRGGDRSAA